jgi:hypothetical protein
VGKKSHISLIGKKELELVPSDLVSANPKGDDAGLTGGKDALIRKRNVGHAGTAKSIVNVQRFRSFTILGV